MDKQYVIFKLNNEEYGMDIENVREIIVYKNCTKIPNAPKFIEGMIDIRGCVTPIINLKKRLNLDEKDDIKDQRIIIINIKEKQVGFIVDDASQVLTLSEKQIEDPPEIIMSSTREYIVGVGKVENKIILLLDLEKVLSKEEKEDISKLNK